MGLAMDVLGRTDPGRNFLPVIVHHPRSPRWLATVHQQEKAQKTLTRIGGETYARQTLEELNQLTQSQGNRQNNEWKSVLPPGNAQSTDHWNRSGHIPAMVRH